jgi:signal transduction histidine kinase
LAGLVEEILSIADLDRGTVDFDVARSDLATMVHDVCDRVGKRYPMVRMERDIPETMYAVVDPARISEAVAQLVDNACRYSPAASSVRIRLRAQDEGVVFSVTDTGLGLSREVASLAFQEPFVTGEEVLRKERAGVGLGLHLARRLVLLHGGILWADPLPAGGTRVSFCIPTVPPGAGGVGMRVGRVDESGHVVAVEAGQEGAPTISMIEVTDEPPAPVSMIEVTDEGPISGVAAS